ncbi:MAG TPA: molybdopterin-dependent oxidoreductase [Candidatus Xenobia bacterium]|jgi:DMSO/TMAO reductase YedYZ molybdopterin-dependent catalytic subunit
MHRRDFLVGAGGIWLAGGSWLYPTSSAVWAANGPTGTLGSKTPFPGARFVGNLRFGDEGDWPLNTPVGEGVNGRVFTDLSKITPDHLSVSAPEFYVRSRASEWIPGPAHWTIHGTGLVKKPVAISMSRILAASKPIGEHLLECSGNQGGGYSLISSTSWKGVPLQEVLSWIGPDKKATQVVVEGWGRYSADRPVSWVFPKTLNGYLATHMGGKPLLRDHGAPVRLFIPNWYGCCNIKWVKEIRLVGSDEAPTEQMQEYAGRTQQPNPPPFKASDWHPGHMNATAMPIRVEQWQSSKEKSYRIVGLLWGGPHPAPKLEIRIDRSTDMRHQGTDGKWVPVDVYTPPSPTHQTWTLWYHDLKPWGPGRYDITLRTPGIPSFRLDNFLYRRFVAIRG